MIGTNKVTGEIMKDLDPSDKNNAYYTLDKRVWGFTEELPNANVCAIEIMRPGRFFNYRHLTRIHSLNDLCGVFISKSGHFFRKEDYSHA